MAKTLLFRFTSFSRFDRRSIDCSLSNVLPVLLCEGAGDDGMEKWTSVVVLDVDAPSFVAVDGPGAGPAN